MIKSRLSSINGGVKKNVIDEIYGRLKIVKRLEYIKGSLKVLCLCSCGNYKEVYYANLKRGKTKSCGCLRAEVYTANKCIDIHIDT